MPGETSIKLRLSVWRDFVPNKALIFRSGGQDSRQVFARGSDLQQEIYTWQTKEDPFGGVSDEETRLLLRKLLVERFEASQPPSHRAFSAMAEFFTTAEQVVEEGKAEWTVSQDAPFEDEETPYRLNPLLALKIHLEWLMATFAGQPGISVSIR